MRVRREVGGCCPAERRWGWGRTYVLPSSGISRWLGGTNFGTTFQSLSRQHFGEANTYDTHGILPPGSLGGTDKLTGQILIQPGLTGQDLIETVRHEAIHHWLVPTSFPGAHPLARLHAAVFDHSSIWTYLEEAAAETFATRSFAQGLAFPKTEGYVTIRQLVGEGAIILGTAGGAVGAAIVVKKLME